ncbi:MAG: 30S ribosomal protein S2 [Candidatus Colwellbacteria bacterium]|nr:30S ribosomal protein S2 [Candidatus Colwellbacteria bacterium]
MVKKDTALENEVSDDVKSAESEIALTSDEENQIRQMVEAGVFYGFSKSKTNPKMKPYILSNRSGVEIIDLRQTMHFLQTAALAIKEKIATGAKVLFVGTTPSARSFAKAFAERNGMPYVAERWLGGTLTNFKTISERIKYFRKLKEDKAGGKLQKYTKKERLEIDEELIKLERLFKGIDEMDQLPGMLVITDTVQEVTAVREARKVKIPSVGFVNTNGDPKAVNYPVPMNNRNPKSVEFMFSYLEKFVEEGKRDAETKLRKEAIQASKRDEGTRENV